MMPDEQSRWSSEVTAARDAAQYAGGDDRALHGRPQHDQRRTRRRSCPFRACVVAIDATCADERPLNPWPRENQKIGRDRHSGRLRASPSAATRARRTRHARSDRPLRRAGEEAPRSANGRALPPPAGRARNHTARKALTGTRTLGRFIGAVRMGSAETPGGSDAAKAAAPRRACEAHSEAGERVGAVSFSTHAFEDRSGPRSLDFTDALEILRSGLHQGRHHARRKRAGEWKCKVVDQLDKSSRWVGVPVVVIRDEHILITTVEWEDTK